MPNGDFCYNGAKYEAYKTSPSQTITCKDLITRSYSARGTEYQVLEDCVAGSVGLEPTLYATKKRCITIMLRPNVGAIYAEIAEPASQKK